VSPCFISLGFNAEIKQKHPHCVEELKNITIESKYFTTREPESLAT
jgi:hypothetical protein